MVIRKRNNAYQVDHIEAGKRIRRSFATRKEAKTYAEQNGAAVTSGKNAQRPAKTLPGNSKRSMTMRSAATAAKQSKPAKPSSQGAEA